MTNGEITIGRSRTCDIVLSEDWVYASQQHATMYKDGSQLMYKDNSRNGTIINDMSVNNKAVPVDYGDNIMIAGDYPLDWNQVERFFPRREYFNSNNRDYPPTPQTYVKAVNNYEYNRENSGVIGPDLTWNWGAFMLYPLWGFWNGCWWAIFIAFFLGWTIIPSILFGAYGSKWAWANKDWRNVDEFNRMQAAWRPWGIAFFVINVILWGTSLFLGFGLIVGLLSYLA